MKSHPDSPWGTTTTGTRILLLDTKPCWLIWLLKCYFLDIFSLPMAVKPAKEGEKGQLSLDFFTEFIFILESHLLLTCLFILYKIKIRVTIHLFSLSKVARVKDHSKLSKALSASREIKAAFLFFWFILLIIFKTHLMFSLMYLFGTNPVWSGWTHFIKLCLPIHQNWNDTEKTAWFPYK